jgi:hypothetical protein
MLCRYLSSWMDALSSFTQADALPPISRWPPPIGRCFAAEGVMVRMQFLDECFVIT